MNLAQIRSAVPGIFKAQTKESQTVLKTEPYLRVVTTPKLYELGCYVRLGGFLGLMVPDFSPVGRAGFRLGRNFAMNVFLL